MRRLLILASWLALAGQALAGTPVSLKAETFDADGVVTLSGSADRRSSAELAVRLTRAVDGVVDVVDNLTWEYDDSIDVRRRYVFDAQVRS